MSRENLLPAKSQSQYIKAYEGNYQPDIIRMDKDFSCVPFCCLRPNMKISRTGYGNIREAKFEFRWCAIYHDLVNENEEKKFYVDGTCYQLGIFCPCCKSVRFLITDEIFWRF